MMFFLLCHNALLGSLWGVNGYKILADFITNIIPWINRVYDVFLALGNLLDSLEGMRFDNERPAEIKGRARLDNRLPK